MGSDTLTSDVRAFIVDNFLFDDAATLDDNASLLGTGVIDSTGVLELISFIESTYGITLADDELVADNFDSVKNITTFLSRKLA